MRHGRESARHHSIRTGGRLDAISTVRQFCRFALRHSPGASCSCAPRSPCPYYTPRSLVVKAKNAHNQVLTRVGVGYYNPGMPRPVPSARLALAKAMLARGLCQSSLAPRLGITQSSLSRILSGRQLPGREVRLAIERELGIPADRWGVQMNTNARAALLATIAREENAGSLRARTRRLFQTGVRSSPR